MFVYVLRNRTHNELRCVEFLLLRHIAGGVRESTPEDGVAERIWLAPPW